MVELVDSDDLTCSEEAMADGWEKLKRRKTMKRKVRNWKTEYEFEKILECSDDAIGCAMQFQRDEMNL